MPIAIIVSDDAIPAIIEAETETELFDQVKALAITPVHLDLAGVKAWLHLRPAPAGWYDNRADALKAAKFAANAIKPSGPTPEKIRDARAELGLSRVAFGRALKFNGNDNTVNKTVWELENKPDKGLRPDKQEILAGLLADHRLQKAG